MTKINGIIPVLPTPFTYDEDINLNDIKKLVEAAVRDGADALGLFGTGGEFYKLAGYEKKLILDTVLEVLNGRLPVIATISEHSTHLAAREAKEYEKMGVDVINIFPQHFASPNGTAMKNHIMYISDTIRLPIMIQHAPQLTGAEISAEIYREISKNTDRELYIKVESEPTGTAIDKLLDATDGRYNIVVGNAGVQMYEALTRKACAIMPGTATIRAYSMIYKAYLKGDDSEAFRLFNELLPYICVLGNNIERFVVMEKMILEHRGIISNHITRNPNEVLDDVTIRLLFKQFYRINGVFDIHNDENPLDIEY